MTMTADQLLKELAAGLRDVITETPDTHIEADPEKAFLDLACRLVLRLKTLTVVPSVHGADRVRQQHAEGALRILDIFTKWMRGHPERSCSIGEIENGEFAVVLKSPSGLTVFRGGSVQDAYAQAAMTVDFNEGSFDDTERAQDGN